MEKAHEKGFFLNDCFQNKLKVHFLYKVIQCL